MFCPKCSSYLREDDLIKKNTKFAPGNIPIEYDARCPNCNVEMGRVSWGKLTIHPDLVGTDHHEPPSRKPLIPPPGSQPLPQETPAQDTPPPTGPFDDAPAQPETKQCPHCGMPLPPDF